MTNDTTTTTSGATAPSLSLIAARAASGDWESRETLQKAVLADRAALLARHADLRDEQGRQQIVGNGYHDTNSVLTGAGQLDVKVPRTRDRFGNGEDAIKFSSAISPRYLRRSKNVEELIPWLYLKGVSSGDLSEALQAPCWVRTPRDCQQT